MVVNQTEYLSMLAEFHKNLRVIGLHGSIETHFFNELAKDYTIVYKVRQKDLEEE